jgi:hypothetical protein
LIFDDGEVTHETSQTHQLHGGHGIEALLLVGLTEPRLCFAADACEAITAAFNDAARPFR